MNGDSIRECLAEDLAIKVFMKRNPREDEDPELSLYEKAEQAAKMFSKVLQP